MPNTDPIVISALSAFLSTIAGVAIGGLISYRIQKLQNEQDLRILRETHKTEFMAENTVRYYLSHKGYTDRSFDILRRHIGGFEDEELRKILVRAGAIRIFRDDGTEWWRLLERSKERAEKKKAHAPAPTNP